MSFVNCLCRAQWQDAMTSSREGWAWPCESAEEAIDAFLAFKDDVAIVL